MCKIQSIAAKYLHGVGDKDCKIGDAL
jgi:hypothetical protein